MLLEIAEGQLRAVSTDGHRLATSVTGVEAQEGLQHQIIVPRKGILELARLLQMVKMKIKTCNRSEPYPCTCR